MNFLMRGLCPSFFFTIFVELIVKIITMSEKIYVRKVERYTIWEASEPIEIDVEKLRQCEPPYEGNSPEELLQYLQDNVYNNYEWSDENGDNYGDADAAYDLTMEEVDEMNVYSDTREKYEDSWIEVGVPNEEYRKVGRFESFANNMPQNDW